MNTGKRPRNVVKYTRSPSRTPTMPYTLLVLFVFLATAAAGQTVSVQHTGSDGDFFGAAVAVSGPLMAVGASAEASCGPQSGAVYVFREREPLRYEAAGRIASPSCAPDQYFGRVIALSGQRLIATASGMFFLSRETNAVHLFEQQVGGAWTLAHTFRPPSLEDGFYGISLALEGDVAVIASSSGQPDRARGRVYVYERSPDGRWPLVAEFAHEGRGAYGQQVALSGNTLAVAAPHARNGSVYLYRRDGPGRWLSDARVRTRERASRMAVSVSQTHLAVGLPDGGSDQSGRVELYRLGPQVSLDTTLTDTHPYPGGSFGLNVRLSESHLAVVAYDEQIGLGFNVDRVVQVFSRSRTERWEYVQTLDVGESSFAGSLDVQGRYAVVGNPRQELPGAVYVTQFRTIFDLVR